MSSTSSTGNQSRGSGLGSAIRGAFETVQGIGDNLRGNAMDFVDSATGTGPRHSTETEGGRRHTEEGVERMETGSHAFAHPSSTGTTATTGQAPTGTTTTGQTPTGTTTAAQAQAGTTTTTQPPPLPPRGAHDTLEGNGGVVGNDGMGGQTRSNV
ncbi:hypothetical protein L226DRAFT_531376 [Lentinus tigrinus ALCF2SS1-7]|uniref:Uncharacterized protein n=1 Tax=Lentinus tigrinus ALCF2SS1-6 TaxID=1328759 RepID=A0A5C2RZH6_9APHY|nr:hypothetical protein L227DRAFT_578685 [Lentinus tigrinus ALCF2SS1-6]RPD79614.1 hypothetical protein L226DRAFT_531376 [Lentinus tigrinus ALCF2SS1-7]